MDLNGTVKIPGVGPVKKSWAVVGVAVVGGIVGWAWWNRSASPADTAEPAIDPATGLPVDSSPSVDTYTNPDPRVTDDTISVGTPAAIVTNQDWVADVQEKLGNTGYDVVFVTTTLGKYLAKTPLSKEEGSLVQTAWAVSGYPPDGPRTFTYATSTSTPGGGTGTGTPKPTPTPTPKPAPTAKYVSVTVAKFTSKNPPWNSTISGIAGHYGHGGDWQSTWNDPQNAKLKASRGKPESIRPGDTVKVIDKRK